ncbi:VOC family protein [Trichothermofontia sichuanensis]|uniref:VOC family protein n=1 Tax=Trichothermofontia sichuanensis TaxID=3045816 RepID=UPI00249D9E93
MSKPMQLTQCLHVALLVSDLVQAEHFYGEVLGLPKVDRSLNFPGCWYQLGDIQIHLITTEHPLPPLANSDKWGRNPHIAFAVADLEAAKAVLLHTGGCTGANECVGSPCPVYPGPGRQYP